MVAGRPIVIYRDRDGVPAALADRCPHRGTPLSLGRVTGAGIQCGYHGWTFDCEGRCRVVPGLIGEPESRGRACEAFAVVEQDGYIWVARAPGPPPSTPPPRPRLLGTAGFASARERFTFEAPLADVAENALD